MKLTVEVKKKKNAVETLVTSEFDSSVSFSVKLKCLSHDSEKARDFLNTKIKKKGRLHEALDEKLNDSGENKSLHSIPPKSGWTIFFLHTLIFSLIEALGSWK